MAHMHTIWIHGHSMQIEYPDRLPSVWRTGFHIRLMGSSGSYNWFHFAIPTPVIAHDTQLRVKAVMLNFRTLSDDAVVNHVHVYDGHTVLAEHNNLYMTGEHPFSRFEIPGLPAARLGVGISIGVEFGMGSQEHAMEFISAGCDFST